MRITALSLVLAFGAVPAFADDARPDIHMACMNHAGHEYSVSYDPSKPEVISFTFESGMTINQGWYPLPADYPGAISGHYMFKGHMTKVIVDFPNYHVITINEKTGESSDDLCRPERDYQ